ncbi:PREDICTED: tyrosine-protein phosphatase 69D isoform X2 [Nicrophorus vespilloides]|uniref:protein-tyrosine-phosphatase n=1 Tax=Nicrophorus vespilloides TaxID=110193 RepID=A0ABM1NA18_NICVS|nr:PREDICTED: tyrosine-protein phosphatase 69D isoform X2 [Nicrophorus vespilloides]
MFFCQAHLFFSVFTFLFLTPGFIGANFLDENEEYLNTTIEINPSYPPDSLPYGENVSLICKTKLIDSMIWWTFNNENVTDDTRYRMEKESENLDQSQKKFEVSIMHLINVDQLHAGEYICHAIIERILEMDISRVQLNVSLPVTVLNYSKTVRTKLHHKAQIECTIEGYPITEIGWMKDNEIVSGDKIKNETKIINETVQHTVLTINEVSKKDNGTYSCYAKTPMSSNNQSLDILVLNKPTVKLDMVKAIGKSKIFLNWTVNDGNEPNSLKYMIQYMTPGESNWIFTKDYVGGGNRSYVLNDFNNATEYTIRICAENSEGKSQYDKSQPVKTLQEDPVFITEVKVTGLTVSSITISWKEPPDHLMDYVQFYKLKSQSGSAVPFEAISIASEGNLYMFSNLNAATTYYFQVAACNEYSNECGEWSEKVNGTTMDGISGPPSNIVITCRFDNISQTSFVHVSWKHPTNPHGTIMSYNVNLEGNASFINDQGIMEHTTWGPKVTSVPENIAKFYNVSANTNYTVRVSGVTKTKKNGDFIEAHCVMPPTVPDKQRLSRITWKKMEEQGKWMFKVLMPRISERNGPICCYRIYLVRMEAQQKLTELPSPEELDVVSYQEAHRTPKGGAYVAEMFTSSTFHNEIFLGDEQVYNVSNMPCSGCIGLRPYSNPKEHKEASHTNASAIETNRVRRTILADPLPPYDGNLDSNSNYTSFIEVVVHGKGPMETMAAYSNYLVMMNPGPEVVVAPETSPFNSVVQIACGFVAAVLVLLVVLCLLQKYTKQAHAQAVEMITFRSSLRGRQRLVSLKPPDMCPIVKAELAASYIERHRDSDYGFQQEFELLPDRFNDRSTRASDARENIYKNRYPDIKSYDQTRVKISQVDSIAGSDYINANFVLGYKERKKFICAQGPMDTTVNEFWRMIWEQHLELILMLTNLEEYSKTKCAKYWPDTSEIDKVFGDISVTHCQETRYSDYIVRELRISRSGSRDKEDRVITQYHYLVWKDFMAPEHPHGIIKFIKRMNEAYSPERGCILVHCSAGVGRTGTLVALDCLLQQLKDEGQAAIFNTICDLRHQRNFLVQSLKQYIFIYRALMEVAQYGDTEILATDLKTTIDKLRQCDKDKMKTRMEEEFENIRNAYEDRKSCSVAGGEENQEKNRSDTVIPYDRNRVILTPLSGKEHSTYINASFIEGYDNTESFIIAQDPMDITVPDFWRMISEQGISVIVMLSELGEGRCPRYWPEDETNYDHISVRYVQAESCPYYTRREMYVKSRDGDDFRVTHLQYHGWPTVDGEVPEVTRGLIELVDHAQGALIQHGSPTSMVVHCNMGSDRSSMFVGLSILVQQLRVEKRVDIFTTTRKLRSQRQAMISTYAQYEFLHRAIVNYAELHNLCET